MGQINQPSNLLDQIKDIRRQLADLRGAVGLASATITRGGLKLLQGAFLEMRDPSSFLVMFVGRDGNGDQVFQLWRPGGQAILVTQKDITSGRLFFAFRDYLGHILMSDDVQTGGLARPWLPVPMYPLFSVDANSIYFYLTVQAASIASETVLWEGRIPLVSHPRISIDGVWGQATGSNTPTYKLYVGGVNVGTWTPGFGTGVHGPFDISSQLDSTDVVVQLKASATGTGKVAAQVLGCYMRQS
jgi:hypothetical protein